MKISYNWLKWYIPQIPEPEKLEQIFTFKLCEVEEVNTTNEDVVFDLKILPDRAGDLLSHLGVARELSGLLSVPFVDPTSQYTIPESKGTHLSINIETEKCDLYMGRIIRNVSVSSSPQWVVNHLNSIGERSINNIVDASNLVMFDCGQPTHAFDLQKLSGEKINIREAKKEELFSVVGGDAVSVLIKEGDIVVCDNDKTIALAGIKGGTNSGISIDAPYTTDILLEVAHFDPVSVRKTGQRLSLISDARKRFENNVPPGRASYAMRELSALILEMCPNAIFEDVFIAGNYKQEKRQVSFTVEIINEKLGTQLTPSDIASILQSYGYEYIEESGNFIMFVPYWRNDIVGIHDIVEEIGRVYGYDKIDSTLPVFPTKKEDDETYTKIQHVKNFLTLSGYREVMNYTFVKKGEIQVAHGLKGKDSLRTNLSDGLKESFEKNRLNAPLLETSDLKIFEIGTVFTNEKEKIHIAVATKKGIEEYDLDEYIKKNSIDTVVSKPNKYLAPSEKQFVLWSEYPFISRDVSFWSNNEIFSEEFTKLIKPALSSLCVRGPYLIDTFSKDGKFSYAFRFVFQSYEKTLTDKDIEDEWNKIIHIIKENKWEVR